MDGDLFACHHLLTGKVLDLGGGRSRGDFPHGRELGWTILDIDFNLKPTIIGDAQILPFSNNSFASVKCSELTGYLFEPLKMVAEVKRVLKPGGIAVFTSPFLTPFDFDQHDSIRLTSAWWEWAAGKTGLKIEKIKPLIKCNPLFFSLTPLKTPYEPNIKGKIPTPIIKSKIFIYFLITF